MRVRATLRASRTATPCATVPPRCPHSPCGHLGAPARAHLAHAQPAARRSPRRLPGITNSSSVGRNSSTQSCQYPSTMSNTVLCDPSPQVTAGSDNAGRQTQRDVHSSVGPAGAGAAEWSEAATESIVPRCEGSRGCSSGTRTLEDWWWQRHHQPREAPDEHSQECPMEPARSSGRRAADSGAAATDDAGGGRLWGLGAHDAQVARPLPGRGAARPADRSSRPHQVPGATPAVVVAQIERLRRQRCPAPRWRPCSACHALP
jgi:hypothetical protein